MNRKSKEKDKGFEKIRFSAGIGSINNRSFIKFEVFSNSKVFASDKSLSFVEIMEKMFFSLNER